MVTRLSIFNTISSEEQFIQLHSRPCIWLSSIKKQRKGKLKVGLVQTELKNVSTVRDKSTIETCLDRINIYSLMSAKQLDH